MDGMKTKSIGDGKCHVDLNVPQCCYDGGDCLTCPACPSYKSNWLNDHICDEELYNQECCFDLSDCQSYLHNECTEKCLVPGLTSIEVSQYITNQVCDYPLNNTQCCFDGGTCIAQSFRCDSCPKFSEKVV